MKKLLLLAGLAAMAATPMMAEVTDCTPANYRFNNCEKLPLYDKAVHGGNIQNVMVNGQNVEVPAPKFESLPGAAEQYDGGLILLCGGQYHAANNEAYQTLLSGTQLVDLGGEVGKVLAFVGPNCDVNEALKELTGEDYGIKKAEDHGKKIWGNICFFTDPQNTPVKGNGGTCRAKIVYNVYSPTYDAAANVNNKTQFKSNQAGYRQGDTEGGQFKVGDCFDEIYDEDLGENTFKYNPNKWKVMEMDYLISAPEEGKNFHPAFFQINFNENKLLDDCALFIKSLEFAADDEEVERFAPSEQGYDTVELKMGAPAGVASVAADENAPVEYFNLQGVRVANPENGLYIRRQGSKATKVLVK